MVKLMRACQFLRGDMVMMPSRMRCLLLVRGTLVRGMVLLPPNASPLHGAWSDDCSRGKARSDGSISSDVSMDFEVVCDFVVRRGLRFLGDSRNRGNNSKTKQDEESPRSARKLSKKAEIHQAAVTGAGMA